MDLRSIINVDGGGQDQQHQQQQQQQQQQQHQLPHHRSQSYQSRPIQPPPQHDLPSPHRSFSVQSQSPYQQRTPSSNSQYPFPQHQTQTPPTPPQPTQYPPHLQQRESYAQSNPSPAHLQHQNSFARQSPTPQTPPIGMPGATHPYLQHQRSVSSISTSPPASANSQQQQYFNQYSSDNQASAGPYPTSQIPHNRQPSQQSQPGTPLGPPLIQRQYFLQPSSPHQQRGIPPGSFTQPQQPSPAPGPQTIQRPPSTPSAYDSQRTSVSDQPQQRRSQSERDRSLSLSPKTRLPSQPRGEATTPKSEREYSNSTKRKMDDRELSVEEPRPMGTPNTRPSANGSHRMLSISPQQPVKKRVRYTGPPIWAQSVRKKAIAPKINGKQNMAVQPVNAPHPGTNGTPQPAPRAHAADGKAHPSALLGPWEHSITGVKPVEQITKLVADYLYVNVVSRKDLNELASRGVEIEIEAKLGHIIDRETNERYRLPVSSECVLLDNGRVGFKSSMTEAQHRTLNEFLNAEVHDAHPQNPSSANKKRVEIKYKHSRELDSFYELPKSMHGIIPPALREKLNPYHGVKVRITHDQKTKELKAKIIKARICDLDIYSPQTPMDCRISINFEMRFDGELEDLGERSGPDRNKDRLSYTQSIYQIDLTQVTQLSTSTTGASVPTKEHELEIELSTAAVRDQGQKAAAGEANEYLSLVEGFIDNMRVLSRAAPAA
ncbi:uncharacterized protein L3040_005085 [Drepanopeziza brunnea f. sp. 'multigermtubi']|uniref:mRNA-capping enzyme subunit beta n=1 Tax=Marssonina brunnea f. sp. multigermtubi (strain MB_m1) TaxID=1072389 RepID=K1W818_MARBU|nr:mRNA capping enzyme [Drepanopeziza brunnea f. sp. 'multigermtubi' MB_m1]EKD13300.1 mRNA capping enzyme [Drepanopeziza brunnea f. sp. 'multigermtubi' MB_m1]KAJ5041500.1 hypothetical protein L3040_005085 [Drepanopeziza brunnea f. sp. 'multigermtubi']